MLLVIDKTNIVDPSWEQIQQAIEQMDNEDKKWVVLCPSEDIIAPRIVASGGQVGVLVDYIDEQDDIPISLIEPEKKGEDIKIWSGEYGYYPAKYVISKSKAIKAFRYFYDHQTKNPDLNWDTID